MVEHANRVQRLVAHAHELDGAHGRALIERDPGKPGSGVGRDPGKLDLPTRSLAQLTLQPERAAELEAEERGGSHADRREVRSKGAQNSPVRAPRISSNETGDQCKF